MRRKTMKTAGFFLAFGLASGFAAAQTGPRPGPRAREIRRNLHALRLVRMTEALELTEEQTARIFPALARVEKEKAALQQRIADRIRDLRGLLEKRRAGDEEDLLAAVRDVRSLREDIVRKDAEIEVFLEAELSPVQKARYLLFSVDFYRRLGERLDRLRTPAGQGRGRGE